MEQLTFKQRIRAGERIFGASIPMRPEVDWLRAVVARRYHAIVEAAFASHGSAFLAEYRATTDAPAVPLADLRRTDWPPASARRRSAPRSGP